MRLTFLSRKTAQRLVQVSAYLAAALMIALPAFVVNAGPAERPASALGAWTQIWSDEFNGSGGVSTSSWLYDTGTSYPGGAANWGTGEVETMSSSTNNVFQSGGYLNIKAIHSGTNPTTGWTSGRIETQRTNFQPPSGGGLAVEARIRLPNLTGASAQGYWPAFWMLGAPFRGVYTNWPSVGEIDILENVNGVNTWYGTFHCGTSPGGPCNETSGIGGNASGFSPSLQAGFHTFRMEFDKSVSPQQLRWYVDGTQRFTVNSSQVDATTWANATNHGFFVILNVAVGGGWPGNPTSSTASGGTMLVDYVRVYTAPASGGGGSTPTRTATPTSGSGCTGNTGSEYTYGVSSASSSSALACFKPTGFSAGYVILHYIRPGLSQQNVNMTYNSGTARWEYTVTGISAGQVLQYQFTYQKSGLQYDTAWFSWTHP